MDSVLVVIPCFNQGEYLAEAIESALAQTYPVSVTVVDDGSTDDSAEVARRYPVKLLQQENRGASSARNAGIADSKCAWILPLDADDTIDPSLVESLIGLDDIVAPSCLTFGAAENAWIPELAHPTAADFLAANYSTVTALYRREVWAAIGGYDEEMLHGGEDWDFWVRATDAGFTMTVVADKLMRYRVYDGSRGERFNSSETLRASLPDVRAWMMAKYDRLGIAPLPSQAVGELKFWRDRFESEGREGYLAGRKRDWDDCLVWFPELAVIEDGEGLDYGCGLVSIFEFGTLPADACDPLLKHYHRIYRHDGLVRYLDAPEGPYDFILCKNVIDHTPDAPALVERLKALLVPGGRLYFEVNFCSELWAECHYKVWTLATVREHLADFTLVRENVSQDDRCPDTDFYTAIYTR